jgi:hypothetical protein
MCSLAAMDWETKPKIFEIDGTDEPTSSRYDTINRVVLQGKGRRLSSVE